MYSIRYVLFMVCIVYSYSKADISQTATNTQGTYNTSEISKIIYAVFQPMGKNQNGISLDDTIFMKKYKVELISQIPKIAKER